MEMCRGLYKDGEKQRAAAEYHMQKADGDYEWRGIC